MATVSKTVRVFISSTFRDMPFDCAPAFVKTAAGRQGRHRDEIDIADQYGYIEALCIH